MKEDIVDLMRQRWRVIEKTEPLTANLLELGSREIEMLRSQISQLSSVARAVSIDGPLMPASVSINEPLPMDET